jgi:serine/threonine protein kinase
LADTPATVTISDKASAEADPARTADVTPPSSPTEASPKGGPASSLVIPGYEVLEEIGRGGMGVVYKARHLALNRVVALKMVLRGSQADEGSRDRFQREAEAIARLQHPHIVQIYEVGQWRSPEGDLLPFISLEYCAGGSLDEHLDGTPLTPPRAAGLVEILARAVQAAHEAKLVHRDLKPANVLLAPAGAVSSDGAVTLEKTAPERDALLEALGEARQRVARRRGSDAGLRFVSPTPPDKATHRTRASAPGEVWTPKVTDFGLARRLDEARQTASGAILGTPSYMAPEQTGESKTPVGPPSDVYALGAILYECLTGRPPFRAASAMETILQVVREDPIPPSRLTPGVPRDVETVTLKCLQKDPQRRYRSAAALAEDLRRYRDGEPVLARPVGRVERAWRWGRHHPAPALALLLGIVILAGAVAFSVLQGERNRRAAEDMADEHARALQELASARTAERKALRLAADFTFDRAQGLCEAGDVVRGLHWMVRGLDLAGRAEAADLERAYRLALAAWNPEAAPLKTIQLPEGETIRAVCWSPDGRTIATGSRTGQVRLWNSKLGEPAGPMRKLPAEVRVLAWQPRGTLLAAWCEDGQVRLWPAGRADAETMLRFQEKPVHGILAFSPDGKTLATGGRGGRAVRWIVATGKRAMADLSNAQAEVVAFSPDGSWIFTVNDHGESRLWSTSLPRKADGPLYSIGSRSTCAAFSPDGKTVAVADGNLVRQIDPTRGRETGPALELSAVPLELAWTSDGALLLTFSAAGCWLWHAETGKRIGPALPGTALALDPRRQTVAVAGEGKLQLWPLPAPVEGTPGRLRAWVQAITGKELTATNVLRDLSPEQLREAREEAAP